MIQVTPILDALLPWPPLWYQRISVGLELAGYAHTASAAAGLRNPMMPDSDLLFPRPTPDEVLNNLTDFFYTDGLQREVQSDLQARKEVIGKLADRVQHGQLHATDVADVLQYSPHALNALISLLGISQERFAGIFSLKTIGVNRAGGPKSFTSIRSNIQRDRQFANDLAVLLLHGSEDPELVGRVPPFDLEKFDERKLLLKKDALIDSLLRLGLKGRFDAKKGDILEDHIEDVLDRVNVQYQRGEVHLSGLSRDLDFVIPNVETPYVLIESGIFETTARELSDKARVEALGLAEIEQKYPEARFVRVTDGVGWRRRGGQDLQNLIEASHYFLVFKTLDRLEEIIRHHVPAQFIDA